MSSDKINFGGQHIDSDLILYFEWLSLHINVKSYVATFIFQIFKQMNFTYTIEAYT